MAALRFGAVFTGQALGGEFRELSRQIEAAGFASLLVADHLASPMACTPLIAAAAAATTTLRVGSFVFNNDFRHPTLLAKEVATLDVLSDGRMELGIGAGYYKPEYDSSGLTFDTPRVRTERLEEAVPIIRRLLAGDVVEHSGRHYQLRGQAGTPLPVQQPLPLLIGGGGDRIIRLAAREASVMAFAPRSLRDGGLDPRDLTAEALDARVAHFVQEVAAATRSDGPPGRAILLMGVFGDAEAMPDDSWAPRETAVASPYFSIGDASALAEQAIERAERWGITYQVCYASDFQRLAPVIRRLA